MQVFSCKICENSKVRFLTEHLRWLLLCYLYQKKQPRPQRIFFTTRGRRTFLKLLWGRGWQRREILVFFNTFLNFQKYLVF